jgi:hypothetical protein
MCDRITYCDVCECAECPKYGNDCDGDKRVDDLISRSDAIEAVCGVVVDEFDVSPTKGYEVAEKALSVLPSAEPSLKAIKRQIDEHWYLDTPSAEARWIPCSERLPDIGELVFITQNRGDGDKTVETAYLTSDGPNDLYWSNELFKSRETDEVLAWMPLPKPYEGGDDE